MKRCIRAGCLLVACLLLFAGVAAAEETGLPLGANPQPTVLAEPVAAPVRKTGGNYVDMDEAVRQMKTHLLARDTDITISAYLEAPETISEEAVKQLWRTVFYSAMEHTGVPREGDYLDANTQRADGTYHYRHEGGKVWLDFTYDVTYYASAAQEAMVDAAVTELLQTLDLEGKSDYEKVRRIYDYMAANIVYDTAGLEDPEDLLKYSAYGALVDRCVVCQGYASAFYRLALEVGVDARVIFGTAYNGESMENHAWNIVELGDYYYNLDVTWDATRQQSGLAYAYFLKSDSGFPGHFRDMNMASLAFYEKHPMSPHDYAADSVAFGICGDDLSWTLTEGGVLTITGTGEMYDGVDLPLWHDYKNEIRIVFLEEGITALGQGAFMDHDALEEVYFPATLERIGPEAFADCDTLTGIDVPAGVTSIGNGAFRNCTALRDVLLPPGLTCVGADAFADTTPVGVFIRDLAAWNEIWFENEKSNPLYGSERLFVNDQELTDLTEYPELTKIGRFAFAGFQNLTDVTILPGVKTIGAGAFADCPELTGIYFQGGAPEMEQNSFRNVTAWACYPCGNETWTATVLQNYGGSLAWEPEHHYESTVVAPTPETAGYTAHTCTGCGDSYESPLGIGAVIGESEFATVSEALAAARPGDVVLLTANADEGRNTLIIRPGVTLNLGAYDLRAAGLIGFAGSYLNARRYSATGDYGKLIVPRENLVLTGGAAVENGEYDVIPIWNGADAYVLANARINDEENNYGLKIDEEAKTISFAFTHKAGTSANQAFFLDGTGDNALKIVIRLEWANENGVAYQDFVYNDAFVSLVSGGRYNYSFILDSYDILNIDISNLKVTAMILTDSGTVTAGKTWTWD